MKIKLAKEVGRHVLHWLKKSLFEVAKKDSILETIDMVAIGAYIKKYRVLGVVIGRSHGEERSKCTNLMISSGHNC